MNSPLITESYYHVYNRGVEKRVVFQNAKDYQRFLETINYYRFHPLPRKLSTHLRFNLPPIPTNTENQLVKILCFCLMPNHFHLLLEQLKENGISMFLRKVSDSYTRYFNTKNERVGSLFQGKFKAKLVESDEYLLQLSKYIHRNPIFLPMWKSRLSEYAFSSYPGYLSTIGKANFYNTETILSYFGKTNSSNVATHYQNFVEDTEEVSLSGDILIDPDSA